MQDQGAMTRKRSRTRNRSRQRSRRGRRQRREGKPPPPLPQERPQPTAREQWARGAEMCVQTSRSLFEWHHNQVLSLCQGFRQEEGEDCEDSPGRSQRIPHCLDYVYESSSEEEEPELEPIDEGYLQFLEVTIRHQEELRRRRADTTTACSEELKDTD